MQTALLNNTSNINLKVVNSNHLDIHYEDPGTNVVDSGTAGNSAYWR